ncbi:MAG: hypothetical protein RI932_1810 [Pseudomonadota bacterium]
MKWLTSNKNVTATARWMLLLGRKLDVPWRRVRVAVHSTSPTQPATFPLHLYHGATLQPDSPLSPPPTPARKSVARSSHPDSRRADIRCAVMNQIRLSCRNLALTPTQFISTTFDVRLQIQSTQHFDNFNFIQSPNQKIRMHMEPDLVGFGE